MKKNPFYRRATLKMFIAEKEGRTVGRIAAIDNQGHNDFHNEKTGFYGFFESTDDQEVANALFQAAEGWLKSRGVTALRVV